MNKRPKSLFVSCVRQPKAHSWLDRRAIVRNMEVFQDLIVVLLCLGLFAVMLIQLWGIFVALSHSAKILFILILVELFRLLIVYLQEHSISVGVAVEVTIVSVLREVIVHGALDISAIKTASICGLLLILGILLLVCAKTPHMDCMSANTKFCHLSDEQELHSSNYQEGLPR
jgi:uncharacterized membrane protein (DUF373 family)